MVRIWNAYRKLTGWLCTVGLWLAGIMTVAMMVLIFADVIVRALFTTSGLNSTEYSTYMFVFAIWAGMAYTFKTDGFIRVEVLYQKVSPKYRKYLDIFLAVLALVYVFILAYYILKLVAYSYSSGVRSTDISQILLYIPQSIMGLGAVIFVFQVVEHFIETILVAVGRDDLVDKVGVGGEDLSVGL